MIPTPRSHRSTNGQLPHKPTLEIVPDTRFIVFHGNEHEAPSVKLTGRVRLTTPESISILKPKVRLEGKRKISWWYMGGISAGEVVDKRVFWNQEQRLGIESSHKINAGTIEWPFEFELSPSMPESVEGLRETYIVYHLHASVSRPGWNAKDLLAHEHIRLVRTLGQDTMEMTRSRVNSDVWANKLSYSISIPSDAVVFGTSITADVELSPIRKGLRLGKVEMRLMETVVKRIQASEVPDVRGDRSKTDETEVAKAEMDFPEDSRIVYEEDDPENPTMADEMYKFQATLPLPKSLNSCRQDVDSHLINITHRFKLMVNIHNPEGHISQLVCRLPVKIFISPNFPVNESNEVSGTITGLNAADINTAETTLTAPPEYGRHQLDQIFRDIDPSGYMSRAGSGPGTPSGLYSQSRRGSTEIVGSLNALTEGDFTSLYHGGASPSMLHSRLADLQDRDQSGPLRSHSVTFAQDTSGGTSPAPGRSGQHSPDGPSRNSSYLSFRSLAHSPPSSFPISRRTSSEMDLTAVHQADYNMNDLSRVPSYNTTVRTSGPVTPLVEGPPSYLDATSRPPSPINIQRPNLAYLRSSGGASPVAEANFGGLAGSTAPLSMSPLHTATTIRPAPAHRVGSGEMREADDAARLRMLRAQN